MKKTIFSVMLFFGISLEAADKPNIILIMVDDLGWGDVGFNKWPQPDGKGGVQVTGNKIILTPHLDAMAKAGLKFNRFYAAPPVCSPTRGSCVTGRHPYRYGIPFANSGHMKPEELTLAELLKNQGYTTGHFGKWHVGTLTKTVKDANRGGPRGVKHFSPPQANGFDVCFSTESKVPTWDPLLRPKGNNSNKWWDAVSAAGEVKPYGARLTGTSAARVSPGTPAATTRASSWIARSRSSAARPGAASRSSASCGFTRRTCRWSPGRGTRRCTPDTRNTRSITTAASPRWTNRSGGCARSCARLASLDSRGGFSILLPNFTAQAARWDSDPYPVRLQFTGLTAAGFKIEKALDMILFLKPGASTPDNGKPIRTEQNALT